MLNKQETNTIRKEINNMDIIMQSVIREVTRELKLERVELTAYTNEPDPMLDGLVVTNVNTKIVYLDTHRWINFTMIILPDNRMEVHYNVYSYSGLLRSKMIRVSEVVELKSFVTLMFSQDLVLETDSKIVE